MPEQLLTRSPEAQANLPSPERLLTLPTEKQAEPLRPGESAPKRAEAARASVEQSVAEQPQANPVERLQAAEAAATQPAPQPLNKELKAMTLRRELKHIRKQLPRAEQPLSQFVHLKAVRVVSEASAKTLTRPSGLLGGGILAFIGSTGYLYLARHYGFTYNYLIFSLLFVSGFGLGLLLELGFHLLRPRSAND